MTRVETAHTNLRESSGMRGSKTVGCGTDPCQSVRSLPTPLPLAVVFAPLFPVTTTLTLCNGARRRHTIYVCTRTSRSRKKANSGVGCSGETCSIRLVTIIVFTRCCDIVCFEPVCMANHTKRRWRNANANKINGCEWADNTSPPPLPRHCYRVQWRSTCGVATFPCADHWILTHPRASWLDYIDYYDSICHKKMDYA